MFIGNVATAASRFVILSILAKIGTEDMVGQYLYAVAFCLPTITICRFGIRTVQTIDMKDEFHFGQYLVFSIIMVVVGLAIVLGLIWTEQLDSFFAVLVIAATLWYSFDSISDAFLGYFQRHTRMDYVAKSYLVQAISMCVLLAIALVASHNVIIGMLALAAAAALRLFAYDFPTAHRLLKSNAENNARSGSDVTPRKIRWGLSRHDLRKIFVLGAPLAIVTFLIALTDSAPRYILHDAVGDTRLGIFGALFGLASAQNLFITTLGQTLLPEFASLFVNRDRSKFIALLLRAVGLSILIGAVGIIIALAVGKPLLSIVFTPAYATDISTFLVLMLANTILGAGNIVGAAITSTRRYTILVPIQIARWAITYFGSLWLVTNYGLVGVAWSIAAAALFAMVCHSVLVWLELHSLRE